MKNMTIAGTPIPPTARELLRRRLLIAAHEALFRYQYPTEIRGFSVHPCPGRDPHYPSAPCSAPGAHDGSYSCGVKHLYHHTNHEHRDARGYWL